MRIGDKPILDTGFQICVVDQAKRLLDLLKPDSLVVGNAKAFSTGPFEQILDIGIAFQAGDEEDGVGVQVVAPGIASEAAIETGKGAFGKLERSGPVDLVYFTLGHVHENRIVTIGIQPYVQFDRALFLTKFCPRECGKTEIDHRGIEQAEHALDRKRVFGATSWHRCNNREKSA